MSAAPADELFYERQRRIETELRVERDLTSKLTLLLGERDTEIARLREALCEIMVECDRAFKCGNIMRIRARAQKTLERMGA